jgi:nitrate reductase gamma subunit
MYTIERTIASISILWAITALIYQWVKARGKGRRDYSVKSGDVIRGILYNFTWAMLPRHKETIRLHPVWFVVGVLMHAGILIAILQVLVYLLTPQPEGILDVMDLRPLPALISTSLSVIYFTAFLCAISLFLKRVFSALMRSMSSPDDYISVLLVIDFLFAALFHEQGGITWGTFLIHATVLFLYLPLGKLRHALFFFIARADYGARLGYRGTYPVKSGVKE